MTSHVDFLGILFVIWGVLTALVGVSTLALGIAAVALITGANRSGGGSFAALVWGVSHVIVGVPLRRHKPWARLVALMLGSIDLVLLPYGTALGVYALWVLLNEKGKALFAG
jgi:hypothetical protein